MFLPIGKSDAPSARCVPLAHCGYIIVIARNENMNRIFTIPKIVRILIKNLSQNRQYLDKNKRSQNGENLMDF